MCTNSNEHSIHIRFLRANPICQDGHGKKTLAVERGFANMQISLKLCVCLTNAFASLFQIVAHSLDENIQSEN